MSPVAPMWKRNSRKWVAVTSAGLLGLINWPMIAPFLVTRADSDNRADNWIRDISAWALKTVGLITRFLTGRTGSSLSAFQGGRNFFLCLVPLPRCLPQADIQPLCEGQIVALFHCSVGFISGTLENKWREHFLTTQDGQRNGLLWFMVRSFWFLLYLFMFLYCINNH